jgi:hypothetical protein
MVSQTECLLEHQLQNGRKVWLLHHDIPAVDNVDEQRKLVRGSFFAGGLWRPGEPVDPETRVNLTVTCPDGSAAEIELAGDFLNSK